MLYTHSDVNQLHVYPQGKNRNLFIRLIHIKKRIGCNPLPPKGWDLKYIVSL
jgi:hypothetical protein